MFSSLSTLFSSTSTSSSSKSSDTAKILSTVQSQSLEEKIPLTSKEEIERKLASILIQVQQNQVTHLNLTSSSLGRFYELAHTLNGHKSTVCSLAVLKNDTLATSSVDATIKLWDLVTNSCFSTLQGHINSVYALAALPDGHLASSSGDQTIKLWDLASHSCLFTLQGHTGTVVALAVLPNNILASGSDDTTIKLWNLTSHSCLSTLQGHTSPVWALAVLPHGLLASGSDDKTIKIWNLASSSCLATLRGHTAYILALTILPNGQLASSSGDNTIKLWDLASHSCLFTLSGHTGSVFALAVLPNGQLASGSDDKTIKLWDLTAGICLATLRGHTHGVWALLTLPNGQLVSGSYDTAIKLWKTRRLSAKQLTAILNALKNNTSVTDLDLSHNPDIRDDIIDPLISIFKKPGFFSFFSSKPNTTLKTIDLRRTGVSQKGVKELEKVIRQQQLSVEVLTDCPLEWMMIYFLIIFYRANRSGPFADSGLDICKYAELGPFLGIPSGLFIRFSRPPSSQKHTTPSPS